MYPITETLYIGTELYCVVAPISIGGKQSTNWLGEPLYRADKITSGESKDSVAITESMLN